MTKFDIFVVNLKRSVDRREAMREKIKRIRGFAKIYIDGEMVCEGNSPLELHSADSANFGVSQTPSLVSTPKFAENYESQTENPSVVDSLHESKNKKTSSLRGRIADSHEAIQNNNESRVSATESRPIRGAKNRIQGCSSATADFLLESELRGTPPKSEKAAAFWRVGGAGRGVQPFLRKKTSESNTKSVDCFGNSNESPRNDESNADCYESTNADSRNDNNIDFSPQDEFASILHFHFFPATDATKFKNGDSPLPPQYSSKLTRFVKGKDLSFGEMACFSSHYRLWQKCVALDSPIIVLEDDIDFMQDFCQIVDIFKSPFEYVRLHYTMDKKTAHLRDNFYMSYDKVCGTLGYYLTPQAAQKFIKNARFWLFCVDDYMDMFFIHSVKNIIFKPFIISEDLHSATQSTILGREKPQMRFYQKLTRELSRIYFFVIRKYLYFALHFAELRAFFRANRRY